MARKQQEIKVEIFFLSGNTAHFTNEVIKAVNRREEQQQKAGKGQAS